MNFYLFNPVNRSEVIMRKSITSQNVNNPVGPFSQVLKVGDNIYVSGLTAVSEVNKNSFEKQANSLFDNLEALFEEMKLNINFVVKVNVFITKDVNITHLDRVFMERFKAPYPARTLAIVDELPEKDAKIQIGLDAIDLRAFQAMNDCDDYGCNECESEDCEYN